MSDLPRWQCHKQVSADRIVQLNRTPEGRRAWVLAGGAVIEVSPDLAARAAKMTRDDLGYYVRYDDGYESWSPSKAFEDGYSRLEPTALELGAEVRRLGLAGS